MIKKLTVFFILIAGVLGAKTDESESLENKISFSGAFNTFKIQSCASSDYYKQGSVKVDVDRKVHKNWEIHTGAGYAKSVRFDHKFFGTDEDQAAVEYDSHPVSIDSVFGNFGASFWWTYLRIRADFLLTANYEKYHQSHNKLIWKPMGGGLIEAGKMGFIWGSVGVLHPEFPFGFLQGALNANILDKTDLALGVVFLPINRPTLLFDESSDGLSFFIRSKTKLSENLALKKTFNVKPYAKTRMMFEGSLGIEFSF